MPAKTAVKNTTESKVSKAKPKTVETPVVETVAEPTVESVSESTSQPKATRHVPTRESVEAEFAEMRDSLNEEMARRRESSKSGGFVKFLRSHLKRLNTTEAHCLRIVKTRRARNGVSTRNSTNSGFKKPVHISKELAKFTGWAQDVPRSRNDVTKFICEYITKNNLQNPADRRQIQVEKDQKLFNLLQFDASKGVPLYYYSLQSYLKSHYTKVDDATSSSSVAPVSSAPVATPAKPVKHVSRV
jgi:chromatin remodeling complex protein RSC6